ncbi:innexin inx2-like [Centruroides sculpturatus]|uniref:innexin inx2-like n=1 Tax=Centruroides sculpturatus TaxID=218467 RepID=UPI000C6CED8A|nr:innexin inx2-like [Centruroides sculpturatus]
MITLFQSLASLLKLKPICVDNNVFRLHYKFTVGVLLCFCVTVTCYQFFGEPIKCLKGNVRQEALETFCWIHYTYSLPEAFSKTYPEVPYPGIENSLRKKKERVYHKYYQWVCFVLFLQALLFFIPHYIWKIWEGGKIKAITLELDKPILSEETKEDNKKRLVKYLKDTRGLHSLYVIYFVICEILNFVNAFGQLFLIDKFLGHAFLKYGTEILEHTNVYPDDHLDGTNPMMILFPKMAKCLFHSFGSGGSIEDNDVMCILPLNIINEKIYVFLWFWLIILTTLTAIHLVYRFITLMSWQARYISLSFKCKLVDKHSLLSVLQFCNFGDWFLLNLLSKNLERYHFRDLIETLAKEFQTDGNEKLLEKGNGDKMKFP